MNKKVRNEQLSLHLQAIFGLSTHLKLMACTWCSIKTQVSMEHHLTLKGCECRSISMNSLRYLYIQPLIYMTKMLFDWELVLLGYNQIA